MADTPHKFKTGDIVQLVSGGPKMTVRGYDANSYFDDEDEESAEDRKIVNCQWFAGAKLEHGGFPEDSIQVPPAEKK